MIGFPSDYAVVGYNPENADMDRPRGEIIREVFSIVAEDDKGRRRAWFGGRFLTLEAAETAYLLFAPPVGLWDEIRPAYGSEAYARNWREYEADEIAREKDDEIFYQLGRVG
jgi:hypothetical protein